MLWFWTSKTRLLSLSSKFTLCSPRGSSCHQLRSMRRCSRPIQMMLGSWTTPVLIETMMNLTNLVLAWALERMEMISQRKMGSRFSEDLLKAKEVHKSHWPSKVHQRSLQRDLKLQVIKASKLPISMLDQFNKASPRSELKERWAASTRIEIWKDRYPTTMEGATWTSNNRCHKAFMVKWVREELQMELLESTLPTSLTKTPTHRPKTKPSSAISTTKSRHSSWVEKIRSSSNSKSRATS